MELRRHHRARVVASLLAIVATGCAHGGGARDRARRIGRGTAGGVLVADVTMRRTPAREFRVGTFNAGLAVGVLDYARERAPLVADALAALPVDLLCVQEVWLDAHWRAVETAARARLPYALRPVPAATPAGGTCTPDELRPVMACVRQ